MYIQLYIYIYIYIYITPTNLLYVAIRCRCLSFKFIIIIFLQLDVDHVPNWKFRIPKVGPNLNKKFVFFLNLHQRSRNLTSWGCLYPSITKVHLSSIFWGGSNGLVVEIYVIQIEWRDKFGKVDLIINHIFFSKK